MAVIDFLSPVSDLLGKVLDKVYPDPAQKALAQLELVKMQQSGELEMYRIQLSAILAEAQSSDPWTSRARPMFMYVIYIMLLMGIPMGFLSAFQPEVAMNVAKGMQMWLRAIPEDLYMLFGAGYLGYTGARTMEKRKGLSQ